MALRPPFATVKQPLSAKFMTIRSGEIEQRAFSTGEKVHVVQKWQSSVLVKTSDGHYFNLGKDVLEL
jgi:hypothetical protein